MIDISSSVFSVVSTLSNFFARCWALLTNVKVFTLLDRPFTLAHFLIGLFIVGMVVCAFSIAQNINVNVERS